MPLIARIGSQLSPRWMRHAFNLWPAVRGTGVRVDHIADDWTEIRARLPLSWRTRNYVGTMFGGSIYGSVDPFLMLMLMNLLGTDYVVWDKGATIRFRRPATRTLHVTFRITPDELDALRRDVAAQGELDRTWTVELVDESGVVHASIDKLLYVATREAYAEKLALRTSRPAS